MEKTFFTVEITLILRIFCGKCWSTIGALFSICKLCTQFNKLRDGLLSCELKAHNINKNTCMCTAKHFDFSMRDKK